MRSASRTVTIAPPPGRRFVYVVRSRRSGGLSVGINLDPQKTCNFDCVYCEVIDRRAIARHVGRPPIDAAEVAAELSDRPRRPCAAAPSRPRDIAFAGDGEPSTFPGFLPLARGVFDARDAAGLSGVPVILITNGSGLGRTEMREAHDLFAARGGALLDQARRGDRAVLPGRLPDVGSVRARPRRTSPPPRAATPSSSSRCSSGSDELGAPSAAEIAAWAGRLADVVRDGGSSRGGAGLHGRAGDDGGGRPPASGATPSRRSPGPRAGRRTGVPVETSA